MITVSSRDWIFLEFNNDIASVAEQVLAVAYSDVRRG